MSVSAPPRPQARAASGQPGLVLGDQPIRRPDTRSPQVMTRRGWWLVALNFLIPGSAQSLAGSRRLARIGLTATLALWHTARSRLPRA